MCNTPVPVDHCMPLSSLLGTTKINGGVECKWCMKTRDCQQIASWSITAGWSRVINVWTTVLAYRT